MDPVFRSEVDVWLVLALVGVPILALEFLLDGAGLDDRFANVLAVLIVVTVLGIFLWLYLGTHYTVTAEFLLVKSGPFFWSIRLTTSPPSSRRTILCRARRCHWTDS